MKLVIIMVFSMLFALLSCFMLNCSSKGNGPVAGNVSGTPNTLTGTVSTADGKLKAGIRVAVFSEDYVPYFRAGYADTTYTNKDGLFTFDSLPAGMKFNVFAWDTTENKGQYLSSIDVKTPITLKNLEFQGNILGEVLRDSILEADTGLAYITGSPYYVVLDSQKTLMIRNIPPGQYCLNAKQIVNNYSGHQAWTSPESLHINPDTVVCLTILPKDTILITLDFYVLRRALVLADTSYKGIAKIISIENTGEKDSCGGDLVDVRFDFLPNPPGSSPVDSGQLINFRSRAGKASRSWVESLGIAVNKEYICIKIVMAPGQYLFFILELNKETWTLGGAKCP